MKIAVVGAGIAGLSCAYHLHKAGYSVDLFEKSDSPGGRMASGEKGGRAYNLGAIIFGKTYREGLELVSELGVDCYPIDLRLSSHYLRDHKLYDGAPALKNFLYFSFLPLSERIKLCFVFLWLLGRGWGMHYFDITQPISKWERSSAYDAMQKYLKPETVDCFDTLNNVFTYGLKDITFTRYLQEIWELYKTDKIFYCFRGNIAQIPQKIAEIVPVRLNSPIQSVRAENGFVRLDDKKYDLAVIATDGLTAKRMYENPTKAQEKFLKSIDYVKSMTGIFSVPVELFKKTPIVVVPRATSQKIACFLCEYVLTFPYGHPFPEGERDFLAIYPYPEAFEGKSDAEILQEMQKELTRIYPGISPDGSGIEPIELKRWSAGMPKTLGDALEKTHEFWELGQGEQNVYFCGDYTNGPCVESAIRSGTMAANKIIKQQRA